MKKRRKGFTLIEIVIAISIMTLMSGLVITLLDLGFRTQRRGVEEFVLQSGVRVSTESVIQTVRYAKVVFAIPQSYFAHGDTNKFTDEWSYFGVVDVTMPDDSIASEIVSFEWDDANHGSVEGWFPSKSGSGGWWRKVVLAASQGVIYEMEFTKSTEIMADTVMGFRIIGKKDGKDYLVVDSQVSALNALQIMSRAEFDGEKMVAIAYRIHGNVGDSQADIAMVLDTSSAGARKLGGLDEDFNPTQINILKDTIKHYFLETVGTSDSMNLLLLPYKGTANEDYSGYDDDYNSLFGFHNLGGDGSGYDTILKIIGDNVLPDGSYSGIRASGKYSNIGDGMRRAYYGIVEQNKLDPDNPNINHINYAVVFTYGGANTYSSNLYYRIDYGGNVQLPDPPNNPFYKHQLTISTSASAHSDVARFDYGDLYYDEGDVYNLQGSAKDDAQYLDLPAYLPTAASAQMYYASDGAHSEPNSPLGYTPTPVGSYAQTRQARRTEINTYMVMGINVLAPMKGRDFGVMNAADAYSSPSPNPIQDVINNYRYDYIKHWADKLKGTYATDIFYISIPDVWEVTDGQFRNGFDAKLYDDYAAAFKESGTKKTAVALGISTDIPEDSEDSEDSEASTDQRFFIAGITSQIELEDAFKAVAKGINENFWAQTGPRLE